MVLLDASALVELVVAGRHRQGADALLARYSNAEPRLVFASAAHALVEAASALRRLVRLAILDPPSGSEAIEWLSRLDLALDPTAPRLGRILVAARGHECLRRRLCSDGRGDWRTACDRRPPSAERLSARRNCRHTPRRLRSSSGRDQPSLTRVGVCGRGTPAI